MPKASPDEAAKARFLQKLSEVEARYIKLEGQLSDPEVIANSPLYAKVAKEHGALSHVVAAYRQLKEIDAGIREAREILEGDDEAMAELARSEIDDLEERKTRLFDDIVRLFATADQETERNVIMEIRAGTGGEEAALFAADLYGMYKHYAEKQGWKTEVLDASPTPMGGFREIIFSVSGHGVNGKLRYESGGHRVQRVPVTESQGRIHTSACTVAVLPEADPVEVDINPDDLRIDFYRASGPGGQKVNKTSSAVRITHEPTGIIVAIQDEKSQHKNRAKAMRVLRSRLLDHYRSQAEDKRQKMRSGQIGSGDRSQRIRTYNFPQNRVSDHRINLTLYHLDRIIMGDLDEVIEPLVRHDSRERVKAVLDGDLDL